MKVPTFVTVLFFLIALATARPFHAAKCIALGRDCGRVLAGRSGRCAPFRNARSQSPECFTRACSFCRENRVRFTRFPCENSALINTCMRTGTSPATVAPAQTQTRTPQPPAMNDNSDCTYTGVNKVVIDLGRVRLASGWTRTRREGMDGIIFERNRRTRSIIRAGTKGIMCFKIRMREAGQYYTTAITSAPHSTEHNDVWIRSNKGFRLFQDGNFRPRTHSWLKGFQNRGRNSIANTLKNVDHNGHYLITDIENNGRLDICISGRSSLFEMFKIVLVKCIGRNCGPRDVASQMQNLSRTQCV